MKFRILHFLHKLHVMSLESESTIGKYSDSKCFESFTMFRLYEDRLILTHDWQGTIRAREFNEDSLQGLDNTVRSTKISTAGRRTILKRLTAWCKSIKIYNERPGAKYKRKSRYPVMITCTLSSDQIHTDQQIKRDILNPFIKALISRYGVLYYFWRAESQANGRIHFHVLIDKYIDRKQLQILWNDAQDRLGYVTRYGCTQLRQPPPSTHVKAASDWYSFYRYLVKYVTKEEDNRNIDGRKWYMSAGLREIDIYANAVPPDLNTQLFILHKLGKIKTIREDRFVCVLFKKGFDLEKEIPWLFDEEKLFYLRTYKQLYLTPQKVVPDPEPVPFPDTQNDQPDQLELFPSGEINVRNHYH